MARFLPHVVKTTLIARVSNGLMFDEFLEYFSFLYMFVIYDIKMMSFFSAINLKSMYLSLAADSLQVFVVGLYFQGLEPGLLQALNTHVSTLVANSVGPFKKE